MTTVLSDSPGLDFLKLLFFSPVGYATLKDFSYLFDVKFTTVKNYTGDIMRIDQIALYCLCANERIWP